MLNALDIPDRRAILIAGPTASGKSDLAMELAVRRDGIVVNADALQVYSCWRVLTARPSVEDEERVRHLLYGHVNWQVRYSTGDWLREIESVVACHAARPLIIVGGTGLYFSAFENGLAPIPPVPDSVREESKAVLETGGLARLLSDLERNDPGTLSRIDRQNPMRVQRAWEVLRATGRGLASWQEGPAAPVLPASETDRIVLHSNSQWLSNRIEARLRKMVRSGALDECRAVMSHWTPELPSARAHGASDFIAHLNGKCSLEDAMDGAIISTRQYAKRQRTWFRSRMAKWKWVAAD